MKELSPERASHCLGSSPARGWARGEVLLLTVMGSLGFWGKPLWCSAYKKIEISMPSLELLRG